MWDDWGIGLIPIPHFNVPHRPIPHWIGELECLHSPEHLKNCPSPCQVSKGLRSPQSKSLAEALKLMKHALDLCKKVRDLRGLRWKQLQFIRLSIYSAHPRIFQASSLSDSLLSLSLSMFWCFSWVLFCLCVYQQQKKWKAEIVRVPTTLICLGPRFLETDCSGPFKKTLMAGLDGVWCSPSMLNHNIGKHMPGFQNNIYSTLLLSSILLSST